MLDDLIQEEGNPMELSSWAKVMGKDVKAIGESNDSIPPLVNHREV